MLRPRRFLRCSAIAIAIALCGSTENEARAEADTFGVGDGHSGAKTVAGTETVNSYAAITADVAAGATTISFGTVIGNAAGFAANDLILVWRATGVAETEAPSGNQTKRLDLATSLATTSAGTPAAGLTGQYEFARVQSVAAGVVTLTKPLVKAFTKNVSQIVRVPEYTTVNVPAGATLTASVWQEVGGNPATPNPANPWAGGILIFLATGAITNNGTIHANERGFHGATPESHLLSLALLCDTASNDGNSANGSFAPKGQGVVHTKFTAATGGKGNIAMAGGGGNCTESGGGGGANQGNGGVGSGTVLNLGSGGLGGIGIDYDVLSRLTMGGGGGAGRHNVGGILSSQVAFGGFGGGVVYIRGLSMEGTTGKLQANGGDGEDSGLANLPVGVASQGSGGGGAGGTIVLRLAGTLDCDSLGTPGGDGGSAEVAGLPVFGAGGGGGGGRVFFQAATKTAGCDIIVTPGSPGNSGQGGSQPGNPGGTTPGNGFCFDTTPGSPGACADPTPVCDPASGNCNKCDGPFSSATPHACGVNVKPVCLPIGACVPCNGDFNSGSSQACQLVGSPTCFPTGGPTVAGSCGKCTTNADCTGPGHPGPVCNIVAGACGTSCTKDEDCKPTEWCAPKDVNGANVCIPKTPNSQPVPPFDPINGECTKEKGQRVCLSAVCEVDDDLCGLKNSTPCTDAPQCRSSICFPADKLCGLPNGEPCSGDGQCRSAQCKDGICTGCKNDNDCKLGEVCDPSIANCTPGCRPGVQSNADGGQAHGGCPSGQQCIAPDGGPIGQCQPVADAGAGDASIGGGDAGDTSGIVEGGGCSCNSLGSSSAAPPLAIFGVLCSGLLVVRRRQRSKKSKQG